ncbi:MAG TPA: aromatic-ring-hydroxylating dioxygenase subunit beta [Candidatus Binatia bacterium]|nr:aromatic-ring-hydroxylating dioxygenase subunit beta [Candidatus Binatia bacterium]
MKPIDSDRQRAVEAFLYAEADLLDRWQLDEWLALFTEDCRYVVPTTDLPGGDPERDLVIIDDRRVQLEGRVRRLKSRHAYREYPSSRTRRLITNVRIVEENAGEIIVEANFAVYRFRSGASEPYVGSYRYHLVPAGDQLRIRLRRATLDNETLRGHGAISIIL